VRPACLLKNGLDARKREELCERKSFTIRAQETRSGPGGEERVRCREDPAVRDFYVLSVLKRGSHSNTSKEFPLLGIVRRVGGVPLSPKHGRAQE